MASSLRRPRGSFLPKGNEPAGADPHRIAKPRVINVRGARVCNLLSSARAHCWQGFDAHRGRRPLICAYVLMYYVLGSRELVAPASAGAPPLPAQACTSQGILES